MWRTAMNRKKKNDICNLYFPFRGRFPRTAPTWERTNTIALHCSDKQWCVLRKFWIRGSADINKISCPDGTTRLIYRHTGVSWSRGGAGTLSEITSIYYVIQSRHTVKYPDFWAVKGVALIIRVIFPIKKLLTIQFTNFVGKQNMYRNLIALETEYLQHFYHTSCRPKLQHSVLW